jgi:hypothetical protein
MDPPQIGNEGADQPRPLAACPPWPPSIGHHRADQQRHATAITKWTSIPSRVINFVAQQMHRTTKDKQCVYVTAKRLISSTNQQSTSPFGEEIRMLFSSKHRRNKEQNKRTKSNSIIHCAWPSPHVQTHALYIMTNKNTNLPIFSILYHQFKNILFLREIDSLPKLCTPSMKFLVALILI